MTYDDVLYSKAKLEATQARFLRERGWYNKCDSPGAFWYWEKIYNGRRWTSLTLDSAISLQMGMEGEK